MDLKLSDLPPQFEKIALELGERKLSYYLKNLEGLQYIFLLKR